jgi:hypothetical protein
MLQNYFDSIKINLKKLPNGVSCIGRIVNEIAFGL